MKRILAFVFSAFAAFASFGEVGADGYVIISVPWTYSVQSGTFNIGVSQLTTKKCLFVFENKSLNDVMTQYGDYYDDLLSAMTEDVGASIADSNASKWSLYISQTLFAGLAAQQQYETEELAKLTSDTNLDIEQYASRSKAASSRISSLQNTYKTSTAKLIGNLRAIPAALDATMQEQKQELEKSIKDLQDAQMSAATEETIAQLQNLVTQYAAEYESTKKAIDDATKKANEIETANKEIVRSIDGAKVAFSNDMNNVTRWLGYKEDGDNPLVGKFLFPRKLDGSDFDPETQNVLDFIEDRWGVTNNVTWLTNEFHIVTNTLRSATNTLRVATNVLFNANGGVTNVLYGGRGMLATIFGFDFDTETGEKKEVAETFGGITNIFTANINVSNGFDEKSVWTNGEKKVEIAGFHKIEGTDEQEFLPFAVSDGDGGRVIQWKQNVPALDNASTWTNNQGKVEVKGFNTAGDTTDYDYVPVRVDGGDDGPQIEWQTNAVRAIARAIGFKRVPTKSEVDRMWDSSVLDSLIDIYGVLAKLYGSTGIVQSVNKAINVSAAYDNASVWTNGEAKVEVKGYHKAGEDTFAAKKDDGLEWQPIVKGDSDAHLDQGSSAAGYIDTIISAQEDYGDKWTNVLTLVGFKDAKDNAVPFKCDSDGSKSLGWADPPDGVTADAPKVLTFDGSTVAWGAVDHGSFSLVYNVDGVPITVRAGCVMIGRKPIRTAAFDIYTGSANHKISVKIMFSENSATAEIIDSADKWFHDPEDNVSYIPLYDIRNYSVYEDLRGVACVPAYN